MDFPYTPDFVDEAAYDYLAAYGAWYLAGTSAGRANFARDVRAVHTMVRPALGWVARGAGVAFRTVLGPVAAGYAIGATIGTGIAYAGWGKHGASDAFDLYTGQVSFNQYVSTIGNLFD